MVVVPRAVSRAMARRGSAVAAFVVATASGAAGAWADTELQATLSGSVGYTDNLNGAPSDPPTGTPGPEGSFLTQVGPGVLVVHTTPRATYRAGYTFTASFSEGPVTYAHQLSAGALFVTSPTTDVSLGGTASLGQVITLVRSQGASSTQAQALPSGGTLVGSAGVEQGLSKELSEVLRLSQRASFVATSPLGVETPASFTPATIFFTRSWDFNASVGLYRVWKRDALGAELRGGYLLAADVTVDPVPVLRHQVTSTLVAQWFHDLGTFWSSQIDLGLVHVASRGDEVTEVAPGAFARVGAGGQIIQPAGLAALRYAREEGQAELSYAHGAQANPYLGQIFLTDAVTLRGGLPLGQTTNLVLSSSIGYQHATELATDSSIRGFVDVIVGDVELGWIPLDGLLLAVRYQRYQQLPNEGVRTAGGAPVLSIVTNTGLMSATLTLPMRRRPAQVYRPPLRVDRSDEVGSPRSRSR